MFPSRKFDKVNDKLWPKCSCLLSENSVPTYYSLVFSLAFPPNRNWRAIAVDFQFHTHNTEDTTPTLSIHLCHLSSNRVKLNKTKEKLCNQKRNITQHKAITGVLNETETKKKRRWKMKLMVAGSNVSHRKRYRILLYNIVLYIRTQANHMTYINIIVFAFSYWMNWACSKANYKTLLKALEFNHNVDICLQWMRIGFLQ